MNKQKFKDIYNNLEKYPKVFDVAIALDVTQRTIRRWVDKFRDKNDPDYVLIDRSKIHQVSSVSGTQSNNLDLQLKITKTQSENVILKRKLKEAHKEVIVSKQMKELIHGTNLNLLKTPPKWLNPTKKDRQMTGIPVLFISDIHFDEVIDQAQIGYVNKYNHDIAVDRIKHTFKTTINILTNYMANPSYDGIVCAFGGDLLSGNIHEELAETNAQSILQSVNDITELLIEGLGALADTFHKVFVPCVVGNHGRLHHKPRHKNKVFDNFEWLIYQNLAKYFNDDKRITFYIPEGPDAVFSVFDKKFLLTHGDQFRGGNAIAGIFSPLMLGMMRKQKKHAAIEKPFDVMMCGHFHQYIHSNSLIVNGSVKGYDEFASNFNFSFEPPQQAMFIVHPIYGISYRIPIMCDAYEKDENKKIRKKVQIIW